MTITREYIEFNLKAHRDSGYDIVGDLIIKYFNHNDYSDVIVRIGTSYDGKRYDITNEVAFFENCDILFENDWWEGERFIRVYGIVSIDDVDVSGGLYPD